MRFVAFTWRCKHCKSVNGAAEPRCEGCDAPRGWRRGQPLQPPEGTLPFAAPPATPPAWYKPPDLTAQIAAILERSQLPPDAPGKLIARPRFPSVDPEIRAACEAGRSE